LRQIPDILDCVSDSGMTGGSNGLPFDLCRAVQVSTRHPGLDDLSAQREVIESRDLERFNVRGPG